jgi:tape measure domain-containing protein
LSDSVANLTVKVDTKSVSAAVKALDALAATAAKVEKSVSNIGGKATGLGKAQDETAKGAKKSESALAAMEKRIDAAARQYEKMIRMINQSNVSESQRRNLITDTGNAYLKHLAIIQKVNAGTLDLTRTNIAWKNSVSNVKDSLKALEAQEKRRIANAKEIAAVEKKRVTDVLAFERIMQQAQTRVAGITGRASRQLSPDQFSGISASATNAINKYQSALRTHGLNSIGAAKATGEFNRAMQALSGDIARVGGLLPRISDNARTISAAFGAANASLGGFSRILFNTGAAIAALGAAFGTREIVQSIMEYEKFTNTLRTVSATSGEFQRNLQFLTNEADRIGFSVGEVGNSFARLSLAMKGAGFTGDETRTSFTQLSEAARNFGLSSADTMGVIRALEQSMSKGKFMAEEVRLQLGDRLPIAMAALDKAVTKVDGRQADLNKRFEEGSLDVKRYGTEFIRQINLMSGGSEALSRTSNSISASFGRLGTQFTLFSNAIGEGGLNNAVITFANSLAETMKTLREIGATEAIGAAFAALGDVILLVIKSIIELIRFLKDTGLLDLFTSLAGLVSKLAREFSGLTGVLNQFTNSTNELNKAGTKVNDSISEFNEVLFRNKQTLDASSTAIERRIEANKRLGLSEGDAVAAAAKAEQQRMEIERSTAQRELAAAERAAAAMRRGLTPRIRAIETTQQNIETALQNPRLAEAMNSAKEKERQAAMATRSALEAEQQAYAAANPIINDFLKGTLSALDAVNMLNAAFKGKEIPDAIEEIRKALVEASLDTKFQATSDSLISARKRVSELDQSITEFANKFSSGVYVQFTIDIIRQQEGGARATTGSLADVQQTALQSMLNTQSTSNIAGAAKKLVSDIDMTEKFGITADMSNKKVIELLRTNDKFRDILPDVAKRLDEVRISEEKVKEARDKSENTLEKYIATLRAQIADQGKIAAAYRISTAAGEDAELQLKAETEAIRLGAKTDAERIALKKQILPLLRDEAALEKNVSAAKDLPRMKDEIALLEKERSLLGESLSIREQELAVFRVRQQNRGASPEDLRELENFTRQAVRGRQEIDQLDNSYKEMANIGVRAFEQVGDAITEAFAKGEIRALNFGNVIRGVMSSIVQSILRLGIVNPIINSIFSGTMLPTLGLGLSAMGGGGAAAAGAAAGGGGGIMQLLGLSSLIPKEGIFGSLGLTGSGGLFSSVNASLFGTAPSTTMIPGLLEPSIASGFGGMSSAGTPGFFGTFGSTSLSGVLGGAGAGFGAGMFANSLLGGNQTGGMVGSGLGALGGTLLAAGGFLGPLGLLAGGLLGGVLGGAGGGLFGPKESSRGFGYALRSQDGQLAMTDTYYNEQGRAQFEEANAKIPAINAYLKQRGLTVSGVRAVGGNKYGMGNLGYGEAASFNEALGSLKFAATANEELNKALSTRSFAGPEKLQEFVDGFIALQDTIKGLTADPVPEFKKQMDALIDSFAQATAKAREYGIGEEELLAARDKQIAKLEEQRSLTIRDTALEMHVRRLMAEGMDQEAQRIELAYKTQKEIESFTASLDALGITAEEKSRLLVELERTQAAERVKILKDSNKNIRDYLDSLRTSSPLSGTTTMGRLGAAQELFNRDLAAAQTGNVDALNRITQSADTLLNLAREAYASTGGFHDIRGRVVSGLESLSTTPMSQQSLPDLASVPLVAEMTNLRTNAAIAETAEYTKRFDSKLAELLPIAEAIQAAVEQANQISNVGFDGSSQSAGEGGGGNGGGMGGGGTENALGNVFRHGRIMAYANGGIPDYVNSPTLAPMALFGEAGPEAIMPLRRGSDGRLGVEVNGSDNQAVVSELRAVRDEIVSLREATADSDGKESTGLVEAIAELRVQVGGLREELRTARLRAQ